MILGKDVKVNTPCGCGECNEKLEIKATLGQTLNAEWLVHFLVQATQF